MITREIKIINKLGLHARAAAKLVELTKGFSSDIKIARDSDVVDGKSILGILMLAAAKGSSITVEVDGEDEEQAVRALEDLIGNYFGEGE